MEKDIITTNTQNHNISIDVLRIMAMLMVTVLHATGHGLKMAKIEVFSVAYWIVLLFNTVSLVSVNCFVLISGYFLSKKTHLLKNCYRYGCKFGLILLEYM